MTKSPAAINPAPDKTFGMRKLNFWLLVIFGLLIFSTLFIVFPFGKLLLQSFYTADKGFTLDNFKRFFEKRYYWNSLMNSLKVCFWTTLLSVAIGVPMAYIATRYKLYFSRLINVMIVLSMLSPPFIGAYSWITLLGRNGVITKFLDSIGIRIGSIYGFGGILLVFTLKLFPMVYLYVSGALKSIDYSLEEASENLGVAGFQRIWKITLPVILPTILSSALMVFMTALADFGTPRLIGEGFSTLPVIIYKEFMNEIGSDTSFASALSIIIILVSITVLFIQKWVLERKSYDMSALRPPPVIKLSPIKRAGFSIAVFLVAFLSILPQMTVFIQSFRKTNGPVFTSGWSLESYQAVIRRLSTNIRNTFTFALIAIALIVVIGMFASYLIVRRKNRVVSYLDTVLMFPYVIPGAVLGITLISAFNSGPIVLTGTIWIIIISYSIRKLPYTMRSSVGILYQIERSLEEASISLGVSPMKTFFKITGILMLPGVLSGAVLSFISCINELSSTLVLYTGHTSTISVAIFNAVTNDAYGQASALATILTVTIIFALLVFNKLSGDRSVVG